MTTARDTADRSPHVPGEEETAMSETVTSDALRGREEAITAQDLHGELRAAGEPVGLTTVYRTLASLADAGLLDAFPRDGEQAFRLCSDAHHHHLICEACNKVEEITAEEVERWVDAVASRRGFRV